MYLGLLLGRATLEPLHEQEHVFLLVGECLHSERGRGGVGGIGGGEERRGRCGRGEHVVAFDCTPEWRPCASCGARLPRCLASCAFIEEHQKNTGKQN